MKISRLLTVLSTAQENFGDVPVMLMDEETGDWHPIAEVLKLHPCTAQYECLNRAEPVIAIAVCRQNGNSADLVIG